MEKKVLYRLHSISLQFRDWSIFIWSRKSDALAYLKFEHDEFTNKPILDDNGEMIRRQFVMLEGINCTPETYGSECTRLNRQYGKNNASYAAATPDEEGIGQHDYQSNNDSDHRKTRLNAKKSVYLDSP